MKFNPLPLNGAYEVQLEPRGDARGFFARTFCHHEFGALGLNTNWTQMNMSRTQNAGTLRGLHFQHAPHAEIKLVRCLRGRAYDVIVDLRAGSGTFGQHFGLELDARTGNAIYIPQGFAHGFQTLTPETELQYMHSADYAPDHEGGVNLMDPELAIAWPRPPGTLSDRDVSLPFLRDIKPL